LMNLEMSVFNSILVYHVSQC